jgi:predicted AlkP superfamily pyrophosphatase or phosphodiesterase
MPPHRVKTCLSIWFAVVCAHCAHASAGEAPNESRRVVLIVWDGMRPDFVSERNTPALWKLAQGGVTFRNHHAVYPSATEVNGTSLATGLYPNHNGLIANHEYRPEINNTKSIDTENIDVVRRGDELSGGKYLAAPTIAELVQASGKKTAIAAAKGIGLLQERHVDPARATGLLFEGHSLVREGLAPIIKSLGSFPNLSSRMYARSDEWTTKALTDFLWKDGVPAFSLLWLSEPDASQHETAPGAPAALDAIKSSDENLGRVLEALERQGVRASTDLLVVSDHGFSTIERAIDLRKILKEAGLDVATEFTGEPKPGQIMLAGNGGTVLFYVIQHETGVLRRLVEFLQQSDFAGVIFTREPMDGTFGLDAARMNKQGAPDVAMSFRWNESKNKFGISGMIDADWQRAAGKGTHATLSKFDMHNTLVGAGPDFRRGQTDDLPSGNVDLAPTILEILGIAPTNQMDGRVLSEALVKSASSPVGRIRPVADRTESSRAESDNPVLKPETATVEATKKFPSGTWRQTFTISRIGSTTYLDEGNGAFASKR